MHLDCNTHSCSRRLPRMMGNAERSASLHGSELGRKQTPASTHKLACDARVSFVLAGLAEITKQVSEKHISLNRKYNSSLLFMVQLVKCWSALRSELQPASSVRSVNFGIDCRSIRYSVSEATLISSNLIISLNFASMCITDFLEHLILANVKRAGCHRLMTYSSSCHLVALPSYCKWHE